MIRKADTPIHHARHFLAAAITGLALVFLAGCGGQTPEEKTNEALSLFEQGQSARAVIKLREVIREHPEAPVAQDAKLLLARYHASEGNGPKALENLEQVLNDTPVEDPRHTEALTGIVQIRAQLRDFETVVKVLDAEIERIPEANTMARQSLRLEKANALLALQNDDSTSEGMAILREMMLESTEPSVRGLAREQFANYHRSRGEFEASNAVYREFLEKYPDDDVRAEIELAIAMNDYHAGGEQESIAAFEAAAEKYLDRVEMELEPARKAQMLSGLAQMYAQIDQYERAEALYRRIMAENTMSRMAIDAQFEIAHLYVRAGAEKVNDELFNKGIAVLQQIEKENAGTNIATTAANHMQQAKMVMERIKNAPAQTQDAPTTGTLEATP